MVVDKEGGARMTSDYKRMVGMSGDEKGWL